MEKSKLEVMEENLYQQFLLLVEASKKCDDSELPRITASIIELYLLLSGSNFSKVL